MGGVRLPWSCLLLPLLMASLLEQPAAVLVGTQSYLRIGASASLNLAPLAKDTVLACYFVKSTQYTRQCKVLVAATGTGYSLPLTAGTAYTLGTTQTPPAVAAVAALDSSSAVACDGYKFTSFTCRFLNIAADGVISVGAGTIVQASTVTDPMAVPLGSTTVLVCYATTNGLCSILSLSGSTLTVSATVTVNVGATAKFAAVGLNATSAVVCYQDTAASSIGRCVVVSYTGVAWQVGSEFAFFSSTALSIDTALLTSTKPLVCYQSASSAVCQVLVVSGTTITQPVGNPDAYIMTTADGVSVAPLNRLNVDGGAFASAVICYRRVATARGSCHQLVGDSGLTQVVRDSEIVISSSDISQVVVERLSTGSAIACYVDPSNAESAKCVVLDWIATTTTTVTSTTTSSTRTTSTTTTSTRSTTTTTTRTTTTTILAHIPAISVRNLAFVDQDSRPEVYGGTLSWDPPAGVVYDGPPSEYTVDSYAVYFAPGSTNWIATREPLTDLDLDVGNTSVAVPFNTILAAYPYLLVYTSNPDGRQLTPASLLVRDVVEPWSVVGNLTFVDQDVDRGEVNGTLSWTTPVSGMLYVTKLNVYFATGPSLGNATLQIQLAATATSLPINDGSGGPLLIGAITYFAVFCANEDYEAPTGAWLAVIDNGLPVAGVSSMDFTDLDMQADFLDGMLSWTPPPDESDVLYYRAYLAQDALMLGASMQWGGDIAIGAPPSIYVGPRQARGIYAYFVVWAFNAVGRQRTPTSLQIADRGIDFTDTNAHRGSVSGPVTWSASAAAVGQLRVYIADGPTAAANRLEVALNMQTVEFTSSYHADLLLSVLAWSGDEWRLSSNLLRDTSAGANTVLANAGARLLHRGSYHGQPLDSLVLPFTLVFGTDFGHSVATFVLPSVPLAYDALTWPIAPSARRLSAAISRYLHASPETAGGVSLGLRVGPIVDRAAPELAVRPVPFRDQDIQGRRLGGPLRWEHAVQPEFSLLDVGQCEQMLETPTDCSRAAVYLGLSSTAVLDDAEVGSTLDPPWCYYEAGQLKFNFNGTNTGSCTRGRQCLCDALDYGLPAVLQYAVYLADAPDLQSVGGNQTLLAVVNASTTELMLPMGSRPFKWALILSGNDDGFNESRPAAVRLADLQIYGSWRRSAKSATCQAR